MAWDTGSWSSSLLPMQVSNGWSPGGGTAGASGTYAGGLVNPGGPVAGGTANALGTAQNDFRQALQGGQAGQSINWGGGQLTYDGQGGAMFNGQHVDGNTNLGSLGSQNQGVMNVLQGYGYGGGNDVSAQTYGWQGIQPQATPMPGSGPAGVPGSAPLGQQGMGGASFGNAGNGGTSNPYLGDQVNYLRQNAQENYDRVTAPGIRQMMAGTGGYGGSRQGVLEANAQRDMNNGVNGAIANMLGNNWQQDQTRQTSSYDTNRGLDLQQQMIGANLYGQGMQGMAGLGQGAFNAGSAQQNAAWQPIQNASSVYHPFSGLGGSTSTNSQQGGGTAGAIGGLLGGVQLANNMGLFNGLGGSGNNWAAGTGWGTGDAYGNMDYGSFL